ncbi:MAG: hypothetical protein IKB88_05035 [Clostridia bacterium]|nr:hypothetical protein [Clostridia bacterium]
MDNSRLWWNQIRCGSYLLERVSRELCNENSFIISHLTNIPWKSTFYNLVEEEISDINSARSFEYLESDSSAKPGRQILDAFCPPRIISQYWFEESYGSFLARAEDTLLSQRFIVVSNVSNEEELSSWVDFINEYETEIKKLGKVENKAIFIIESSAKVDYSNFKKIKVIDYDQTEIDIYSFCVIIASQMMTESYHLSRYISELVSIASDGNVAIAEKLLTYSTKLIDTPNICVNDAYSAVGISFIKDINKFIFLAQLKSLFPLLEMYRTSTIEKLYFDIKRLLPWKDDYGNIKKDPYELEIRDILYLSQRIGLSYEKKLCFDTLKDIRNSLAHNKILEKEQIEYVCNLF